jgi:3-oxoacid CoA-transferase subunit A
MTVMLGGFGLYGIPKRLLKKTARNFNPAMATAAELTIVEAEEFVELGQLNPDEIVTPDIYVDRVVGSEFQKPIERRFIVEHAQP